MSFQRVTVLSLVVGFGLISSAGVQAATCDGLTATVLIQELPVGHSACDSARLFVYQLQAMSSLKTKSEIFGCATDAGRAGEVYVRTQLDPGFAAASRIDGFDLGKRLALLKHRHPAIARVEVCKGRPQ